MNLSPDPQLATSSPMDYEEKYNALLLKETKTNNDNIYLKSRFEELKETHKLLINQLVEHKIIKAEEWFETGDISSSLTLIAGVGLNKIEYLKQENEKVYKDQQEELDKYKEYHHKVEKEHEELKEVQKTNQKIREEYEKEIHSIKIAMGCDGPLSWDIKDILKWIEYHQDKVKRLEKDKQTFKDCVVEALGGPEFNGPYKDCIRLRDITEEIRGLKNQVEDPNCSYDPETGLKVEVVMNEDGVILYEETRKENEKLKKENEELKKKIEELMVDWHLHDPLARNPWKEWGGHYNNFEEAIVGEFGDQSEQAKKYGFGVFKKKEEDEKGTASMLSFATTEQLQQLNAALPYKD